MATVTEQSGWFGVFHGLALTAALALAVPSSVAGVMVIGNGSGVLTGSGQVELNCGDIEIAGGLSGAVVGARNVTLEPGAALAGAVLSLSGNWVNNGPSSLNSVVQWPDGCGVTESSMLGSSDLTALTISSQSGREIRFDVTGEQRITDSLRLTGAPGALLRLRSTDAALFARLSLEPGAGQLIDSVDVARIDSDAGQGIAPGSAADYNSVRTGPVRNWFMLPAVPVPTLGLPLIVLLILLMTLFGLFHQRQ